jgi:hypothetical protein
MILRPILRFGDAKVIIGPRQFARSCIHFVGLCSDGDMPGDTKEWKRAMAKARTRRGRLFEEDIAGLISNSASWRARPHVEIVKLGAPQELGDIDVLAIHSSGEIIVIECKDLTESLTPTRLDREWDALYNESSSDKSAQTRHAARLDWVKANLRTILESLGWTPTDSMSVQAMIVTNGLAPTRRWSKRQMATYSRNELEMQLEDGDPPSLWKPPEPSAASDELL